MSDSQLTPPPTPENQPHLNVLGPIQNLFYGSHVVGDQTSTEVRSSVYGKAMAAHGIGYWLLHLLVAFAAAALLELLLHFFK